MLNLEKYSTWTVLECLNVDQQALFEYFINKSSAPNVIKILRQVRQFCFQSATLSYIDIKRSLKQNQ